MIRKRLGWLLSALLLTTALTFAQEHAAEPAKAAPAGQSAAAAEGDHAAPKQVATDSHAQFTESASVKWIAKTLGVETKTAYWISVILNFSILAFGFYWVSRSAVPAMFRDRTASIQKGIEEARKASAESATRLAEIEARLSRLDQDISTMRTQAESEAKAEEERLRAATEEEKRKIVQSAEQDIASAANAARRDLKNLAAELAVALAEKKIAVNEETDKLLVRDFAANLTTKGRS